MACDAPRPWSRLAPQPRSGEEVDDDRHLPRAPHRGPHLNGRSLRRLRQPRSTRRRTSPRGESVVTHHLVAAGPAAPGGLWRTEDGSPGDPRAGRRRVRRQPPVRAAEPRSQPDLPAYTARPAHPAGAHLRHPVPVPDAVPRRQPARLPALPRPPPPLRGGRRDDRLAGQLRLLLPPPVLRGAPRPDRERSPRGMASRRVCRRSPVQRLPQPSHVTVHHHRGPLVALGPAHRHPRGDLDAADRRTRPCSSTSTTWPTSPADWPSPPPRAGRGGASSAAASRPARRSRRRPSGRATPARRCRWPMRGP